jgi:hypothetical protein
VTKLRRLFFIFRCGTSKFRQAAWNIFSAALASADWRKNNALIETLRSANNGETFSQDYFILSVKN